ncbi:MAG: HAD family phosphatase [Oscillospiraceae bacterium]|nr:HAD family phosphatase [Oscillospiraceae bacterium]MBQ8978290.1 HAD family phosphatase [Oscillospiraceae bacterium]
MRIDGFIFDLDGTLIDSVDIWAECDRIFLERYGREYTPEISEKLKKTTLSMSAAVLKKEYDLSPSEEEISAEITDIVRDRYAHGIGLTDGAEEVLRQLHDAKVPVSIATANSRELTLSVLKANNILRYIDHVVTTDDTCSTKYDPKIFRRCSELMGTASENTAVVEDSPHSALTAMEDGFYTIGTDSLHYGDFEKMPDCSDVQVRHLGELSEMMTVKNGYATIGDA